MKRILKAILVVLSCYFIAVISNVIFLEQIVVYGDSMDSTLKNGDFGLADKQFFKITQINRFDIVVIQNGKDQIIKRVIGLPNETITYSDGVLKVNGYIIEEDFIDEDVKNNTNRNGLDISVKLKEDEYYVLGDNRYISFDSRNIGPIKKENIKARLFVIYGKCNNLVCDSNSLCECEREYYKPVFI
ncbi:MAG: signal peptidase I [Bacilli bacterium]|nr:signal peptidase I [Bacilli bacterium]